MKKLAAMLLVAFAGTFVVAQEEKTAADVEKEKTVIVPTVAVLNFDARERSAASAEEGKSVAELLTVSLMESGSADLVERAELEKALNELHLSAAGLTDKSSQVKLGKFIGAKILITGSLFKSGGKNYLVAKVIGTETSRVVGASVSSSGSFTEMVPELSPKLAAILEKQSGRLLPAPENPDLVARELSAVLKGGNRRIFVSVKEDIQTSVPDPAAETELKKLLLALGFDVVSDRAAATFVITGEAIAANAGNYQKFTSASARIELSIFNREKKLLATGSARETLAGGTYPIAAKEAIAQAAMRLAKELFPVMK